MRRIIAINEFKCDGCGLCVKAFDKGLIGTVDGKAKLLCEDSCDGSGNCLASCPQKALHFSIIDVDKSFKFKEAAPFLKVNELVLVASCVSFVYKRMDEDFLENKTFLVFCPKTTTDYSSKLLDILIFNLIKRITILKIDAPCCDGLVELVNKGLNLSNGKISVEVKTINISNTGEIIN